MHTYVREIFVKAGIANRGYIMQPFLYCFSHLVIFHRKHSKSIDTGLLYFLMTVQYYTRYNNLSNIPLLENIQIFFLPSSEYEYILHMYCMYIYITYIHMYLPIRIYVLIDDFCHPERWSLRTGLLN